MSTNENGFQGLERSTVMDLPPSLVSFVGHLIHTSNIVSVAIEIFPITPSPFYDFIPVIGYSPTASRGLTSFGIPML